MAKDIKALKYIHFGLSFGITMALSIYLGLIVGAWLDNYFNIQPVFQILGILLGIGVTFKNLLDNLKKLEKK